MNSPNRSVRPSALLAATLGIVAIMSTGCLGLALDLAAASGDISHANAESESYRTWRESRGLARTTGYEATGLLLIGGGLVAHAAERRAQGEEADPSSETIGMVMMPIGVIIMGIGSATDPDAQRYRRWRNRRVGLSLAPNGCAVTYRF